jgi:hypothetical protein
MFARFAQFAFVATVLAIGGQANAGPLTYGTYYDETVSGSCASAFSCRLNFSQTPADRLLMVSKISCRIVSSGSTLSAVTDITLEVLPTPGGTPLQRHLPISIPAVQIINSSYYINLREDAHYLIGQGRFPSVFLATGAASTIIMNCTLVGDLVTPILTQ